ncbi:hypothetical protein TrLO_g3296 [Triparma laevis f. longispina]|uniref:EF-hand domain-containing protein n=1 Tax=Triparma laevis f. longispina TaxID=1714387 RepID=A0A9W7FS43_9STRA|nr:hypothetical protein TrLO_g3296 [Triparma laevis f. longispina]
MSELTPILDPSARSYTESSAFPPDQSTPRKPDPSSSKLDSLHLSSLHFYYAFHGLPSPPNLSETTTANLNAYLKFSKSENPERYIIIAILILLTFLETPLWCTSTADGIFSFLTEQHSCESPTESQIYLSLPSSSYLQYMYTIPVEVLCNLYLLYLSYLELLTLPSSSRFPPPRLPFLRLLLPILSLFDTLILIIFLPPFRISPYFRLILLALTPSILTNLKYCVHILPPFLNILTIFVAFYGFSAYLLLTFLHMDEDNDNFKVEYAPGCEYRNRESGTEDECDKNDKGFETLSQSLYTMSVTSTNANIPGGFLPSYACSRLYGIYWILYLFFCNFLFQHLVLAVVYNCYVVCLKEDKIDFFRNRAEGLKSCYFELLKHDQDSKKSDGASLDAVVDFVEVINEFEIFNPINPSHVKYMFQTLDEDNSGVIDLKEFYKFCEVVRNSYTVFKRDSWAISNGGAFNPTLLRLRSWVEDGHLKRIVNWILVLNCCCVFMESYQDLKKNESIILDQDTWGCIEFSFSILYVLELIIILITTPWTKFTAFRSNLFDCFVTLLLFTASVVWAIPTINLSSDLLRYFSILRLLRLVELVKETDRFGFISDCIVSMSEGSLPSILTVFFATSLFNILGTQIYGGLIYADNEQLIDSEMFKNDMDVLNFNDFSMGFMTFLAFLVSGGPVTEIIDAFGLVGSGGQSVSVIFFYAYFYIVCYVLFNVFVAFIIDAFLVNYESQFIEEGEEKEAEAMIKVEEGYEVIHHKASSSDLLYKKMFSAELEAILEEASANRR